MGKCFFIGTSPVLVFQYSHLPTHCMLACSLHAHCMLAYPSLACLHAHCTLAYPSLAVCQCVCVSVSVEASVYVVRMWWKCQCVSVRVEVSVFKGFSGRTLRNTFGNNRSISVLGLKLRLALLFTSKCRDSPTSQA